MLRVGAAKSLTGRPKLERAGMSDWMAISQWHECQKMARPGIVFELRNAEGQSMFTPCVVPLPAMPFDWKSPPVIFRAIPAPKPQHSTPIPKPKE
jgi:hypothetical protein